MYLVEKHIIKHNHSFYNECDVLCFKSKNLYNQGLYNVRQYYFENKKYLNYNKNYHITKLQEESYTSKCSFFDNEDIKKYKTYLGKRIKRGLFKIKKWCFN